MPSEDEKGQEIPSMADFDIDDVFSILLGSPPEKDVYLKDDSEEEHE